MSEIARIPCCIVGCKRTFKITDHPGSVEVMCGRHYRHDKALMERLKQIRRRMARVNRIARRWMRQHGGKLAWNQEKNLDRVWAKLEKAHTAQWAAIRDGAQAMQSAGYWAPRPRKPTVRSNRTVEVRDRHADRFEDQFQRMKRAQSLGRLV